MMKINIIEQLISIFDDKDKNIEELKRDLENKDIFKNEIYEKLQDIEKNNEELENFISVYDDL